GSTGAKTALPSFSAMRFTTSCAIRLWPPLTFCGPRCSVPPLYSSAVVFPAFWAALTSAQVIISNSTRSDCAKAAAASAASVKMVLMRILAPGRILQLGLLVLVELAGDARPHGEDRQSDREEADERHHHEKDEFQE